MSSECLVISTAQADIGLKSRNFSLKINKLSTYSEITHVWQKPLKLFLLGNN